MATITVFVPATTILATVTQTATLVVTATPPPAPVKVDLFTNHFYGGLAMTNVSIICTGILVMFIIGEVNRFAVIPMVSATLGALANGLNWYGWVAVYYSLHARRLALIFCGVFYIFMSLSLTLYSYFLLEKILKGWQRRIFLIVYWILFWAVAAVRTAVVPLSDSQFTDPKGFTSHHKEINNWINIVSWASFILISLLESWSAYFLLRTFHEARKNARALGGAQSGLFAAMMRSSEIRVASLVTWSLIRLACYRSGDGGATVAMRQTDRLAYLMTNLYPIVLQLDIIATKMFKYKASCTSQNSGGEFVSPAASGVTGDSVGGKGGSFSAATSSTVSGNYLGSMSGKGAVDSLAADYDQYGMGPRAGRTGSISNLWKRQPGVVSGAPAVVEVAEVPEEEISQQDPDVEKAGGK